MFLNERKEIVKVIDGIEIKFRYPSLADEIQIESKKHLLTRGQYSSMSIGILDSQILILTLVNAIATLSVCASFIGEKEKEEYFWEGFADDDGKEFVLKVYDEFIKWRQSFRRRSEKNNEKQQEDGGDNK